MNKTTIITFVAGAVVGVVIAWGINTASANSGDEQCFYAPSQGTLEIWEAHGITSCEAEMRQLNVIPFGEDLINNP